MPVKEQAKSERQHVADVQLDPAACSAVEAVTSGSTLSANYSLLLACGNWSRTVSIVDGYDVDINVTSLQIGPGDFLAISSGSRMVTGPSTAILVGRIRTARRLRAVRSSTIHLHFVTDGSSTFNLTGFSITFSTDRPLTTTPEPTSPPSTMPTAPANISDSYTVYLSGSTAVQFLQYKESLRTAIKEMAERYCEENNITVLQNITEQNVLFRYVERCDITWPRSTQCIKVQLAVPIVISTGYQLTADNIRDMWDKYASHSSRLSLLGLQVYAAPDPQVSMFMWLGIALGITIAFSTSLLVIWKLLNRKTRFMRTSSVTDSQSRLSAASKQSWIDELPHQELPVHTVGGIREFEPDSMHTRVPLASGPPTPRPHVPVPDSKPLPEYGAMLLFGRGFDKQALVEEDEGPDTNVSNS